MSPFDVCNLALSWSRFGTPPLARGSLLSGGHLLGWTVVVFRRLHVAPGAETGAGLRLLLVLVLLLLLLVLLTGPVA